MEAPQPMKLALRPNDTQEIKEKIKKVLVWPVP